jgi:hypothetical protein
MSLYIELAMLYMSAGQIHHISNSCSSSMEKDKFRSFKYM